MIPADAPFKRYMLEMIRERQSSGSVKRDDLLSNLLEANDGEDKGSSLTEEELMGTSFHPPYGASMSFS